MKQEEVIEIASQANIPDSFVESWLDCFEAFTNKIERRTLERAAVVCETGVDTDHPTVKGYVMKNFGRSLTLARAIRALKDQS